MNTTGIKRGLALSAVTALVTSGAALLGPAATAAPGDLKLIGASEDGLAFDLDEHDPDDITVTLTDSLGPVDIDDAQDLEYYWTVTPFDGSPATVRVPATGTDVQTVDTLGEFVVPLPTQESGTYVLTAGLGAGPVTGPEAAMSTVLTVKAGEAQVVLDDSPLQAPAGKDTPVAGSLELEDGTGLAGRVVDLELTRGTAGNDPVADAGFLEDPPSGTLVTSRAVTTDADGGFAVTLSDPAEDGQGTELGGSVLAATGTTPDVGDADADVTVDLDLVSETLPAGATMAIGDLGASTPGLPLSSQLLVTAPDDTFDADGTQPGVQGDGDTDRDPVVGQVYALDIDKGFFTTGSEELPSVPGDPAGNLESLGTSLSGLTDANGEVPFATGIERDPGFDDDGLVTATVTATAGDRTREAEADWDTAFALNGGEVKIVLSPASEQDAAVNPALEGNRAYYDVFTLDQFGNPVAEQSVPIDYSGDTDNFDYSEDFVTSDFDRKGDLWLVSFQPGAIKLTGTWDAPTYLYDDAAGNASPGSSSLVTGSATAAFYELDFTRSRFAIESSAPGVVAVGSAVTQTVRVLDQRGNPVRGYTVDFFRAGPDAAGSGEPRAKRVTNAQGRAFYTFVGGAVGRARITAQVSDGLRLRTLSDVVTFGAPVNARLAGASNGRAADVLTVRAGKAASGARVTFYRVVKGKRVAVATRKLDATGTVRITAKDRNRGRATAYVAEVRASGKSVADTSNTKRVR
ncbi:Ig-like domain-containing protein [Nocardioides lijunqiniae]|uniref:Ig-like domain-containing protein n=1 Tax=Nocardioides lijunqiniae TaxID=2760832 RepID=UPI001878EF0A|nr:hypothetical protein [Nocardioides lijunqiniae]